MIAFALGVLKFFGVVFALIALILIVVVVMRRILGVTTISYRAIGSLRINNGILVLDVNGPIFDDPRTVSPYVRSLSSFGEEIYAALILAAKNPKIVGVVMRFATPGGSPSGSDLIAQGIAICREKKPVYVHINPMSASGGVLSMVGADKIFASREALVGSIGVIGPTLIHYKDVTEIGQGGIFGGHVRAGSVTVEMLSKGVGKTFGSPFVEVEPMVREHYDDLLARIYARFVSRVAKHRQLPVDVVEGLGALLYDASAALEHGLIDGIATFDETVKILIQKLGIKQEDCKLVFAKRSMGAQPRTVIAEAIAPFVPNASQSVVAALRSHPYVLLSPLFFSNDR